MEIFSILYNTGKGVEEVPFSEERVDVGSYKLVTSEFSENKLFAKIDNVPISMVASSNKEKLNGLV